jgi:4'-phosphopantetheinyl transferase
MSFRLQPGSVHLWLLEVGSVDDPASYGGLLSAEELRRCERFPEASRAEAILTRVLLRTCLSRYNAIAPQAWQFATGEHGKPFVSSPATDLAFNLSHSGGWIVCAVSAAHELGVDLQFCDPARNVERLARRYFSPAEVAVIGGLDGHQKSGLFYDLWALKEAQTKALGGAIAAGLSAFSFDLSETGVIAAGSPAGTHFLWDLTPAHRLALCVLGPRLPVAQVQLIDCQQLADFQALDLPPRAVGEPGLADG